MRALTLAVLAPMRVRGDVITAKGPGSSPLIGGQSGTKEEWTGTQRPHLLGVRHEARVDSVGGTWCHSG